MTTGPEDDLRNIGITPRERLQRIEELLHQVAEKLDNKANREDMLALEVRIWQIEMNGTKATTAAVEEAHRLAMERVEDLRLLEEEYHQLRTDHEGLSRKIAWGFGALATAAVVGEYVLGHILG